MSEKYYLKDQGSEQNANTNLGRKKYDEFDSIPDECDFIYDSYVEIHPEDHELIHEDLGTKYQYNFPEEKEVRQKPSEFGLIKDEIFKNKIDPLPLDLFLFQTLISQDMNMQNIAKVDTIRNTEAVNMKETAVQTEERPNEKKVKVSLSKQKEIHKASKCSSSEFQQTEKLKNSCEKYKTLKSAQCRVKPDAEYMIGAMNSAREIVNSVKLSALCNRSKYSIQNSVKDAVFLKFTPTTLSEDIKPESLQPTSRKGEKESDQHEPDISRNHKIRSLKINKNEKTVKESCILNKEPKPKQIKDKINTHDVGPKTFDLKRRTNQSDALPEDLKSKFLQKLIEEQRGKERYDEVDASCKSLYTRSLKSTEYERNGERVCTLNQEFQIKKDKHFKDAIHTLDVRPKVHDSQKLHKKRMIKPTGLQEDLNRKNLKKLVEKENEKSYNKIDDFLNSINCSFPRSPEEKLMAAEERTAHMKSIMQKLNCSPLNTWLKECEIEKILRAYTRKDTQHDVITKRLYDQVSPKNEIELSRGYNDKINEENYMGDINKYRDTLKIDSVQITPIKKSLNVVEAFGTDPSNFPSSYKFSKNDQNTKIKKGTGDGKMDPDLRADICTDICTADWIFNKVMHPHTKCPNQEETWPPLMLKSRLKDKNHFEFSDFKSYWRFFYEKYFS